MNNLLSYCGLVDAKIRASDKDLPVPDNNVQLTKTITIAAGSHQSLKVPTCKILHYVVHVSTNQQLLLEFTILFGLA